MRFLEIYLDLGPVQIIRTYEMTPTETANPHFFWKLPQMDRAVGPFTYLHEALKGYAEYYKHYLKVYNSMQGEGGGDLYPKAPSAPNVVYVDFVQKAWNRQSGKKLA